MPAVGSGSSDVGIRSLRVSGKRTHRIRGCLTLRGISKQQILCFSGLCGGTAQLTAELVVISWQTSQRVVRVSRGVFINMSVPVKLNRLGCCVNWSVIEASGDDGA